MLQSQVFSSSLDECSLDGPDLSVVVDVHQAFSGQGNRLDGKCKTAVDAPRTHQPHEIKRSV